MTKKYDSWAEYVMDSPEAFAILITIATYTPALLFGFIMSVSWIAEYYEFAVIMSILFCISVWTIIKFHKNGGYKALPKFSAGEYVWNRPKTK